MPGFACARAMSCHVPSGVGAVVPEGNRFDRWNMPVGALYSEIHMVPPVRRLVFMDPKGEEQGTTAVNWERIRGEVSDILVSDKVGGARLYNNSLLATHFAVYLIEFSVRNCRTAYRSHGNRVFQQSMYKYSLQGVTLRYVYIEIGDTGGNHAFIVRTLK
jgi:hypothetical protein